MTASMFFRLAALMCQAALIALLAWWRMPGPALTVFLAILLTLFSLFEDAK